MRKKEIISVLLTVFVIAIYLIPNFATALQVGLDKSKYKRTDTIKFSITHDGLNEIITNVTLFVDDSLICESCNYTEIKNNNCTGLGYGYGYGCEVNSFEAELIYSFESLSYGEHSFKITLNSKDSKSGKFTIEEIKEKKKASSGSKRSSGGGGIYIPPKKEIRIDGKTTEISLSQGNSYKILFKNNKTHNITLEKLYQNRVIMSIFSERQTATLFIGNKTIFDLDNERILVALKAIRGGSAIFILKDLTEYEKEIIEELEVVEEETITEEPKPEVVEEEIIEEPTKKSPLILILSFMVVIIVGVVLIRLYQKKKGKKENGKQKT